MPGHIAGPHPRTLPEAVRRAVEELLEALGGTTEADRPAVFTLESGSATLQTWARPALWEVEAPVEAPGGPTWILQLTETQVMMIAMGDIKALEVWECTCDSAYSWEEEDCRICGGGEDAAPEPAPPPAPEPEPDPDLLDDLTDQEDIDSAIGLLELLVTQKKLELTEGVGPIDIVTPAIAQLLGDGEAGDVRAPRLVDLLIDDDRVVDVYCDDDWLGALLNRW